MNMKIVLGQNKLKLPYIPINKNENVLVEVLSVAAALQDKGIKILELSREIKNEKGTATAEILFEHKGEKFVAYVETREWNDKVVLELFGWGIIMEKSDELKDFRIAIFSSFELPVHLKKFNGKRIEEINFLGLLQNFKPTPKKELQNNEISLNDKIRKNAEAFIESTKNFPYGKLNLDYSETSLKDVEKFIEKVIDQDTLIKNNETLLSNVISTIGSYVAEVIVKNLGGRYEIPKDGPFKGSLCIVDIGDIETISPWTKVKKRIINRNGDDLVFYYEVLKKGKEGRL